MSAPGMTTIGGKPCAVVKMTRGSCEALLAGRPIVISLEQFGAPAYVALVLDESARKIPSAKRESPRGNLYDVLSEPGDPERLV